MTRRLTKIAGAIVALWLLAAAVFLLRVWLDASSGREEANRARTEASPEELVAARPLGDLRRAEARMRAAHRELRNPVVSPLRVLPVVGRQVRALDGLTSAAELVSHVAADGVVDAQAALAFPHMR